MSKPTNDLIFVVESDDPGQVWSGNVDEAFGEFFEAMKEVRATQDQAMNPVTSLEMSDVPEDPGNGPKNAFEASNGLRIWWHNPYVPEEMRPRPSKEDLEKVLEMLRSEKEDESGNGENAGSGP